MPKDVASLFGGAADIIVEESESTVPQATLIAAELAHGKVVSLALCDAARDPAVVSPLVHGITFGLQFSPGSPPVALSSRLPNAIAGARHAKNM